MYSGDVTGFQNHNRNYEIIMEFGLCQLSNYLANVTLYGEPE